METPLLRLLVAGSVDDGKSTLIGRLLCDTGGVYGDQLEAIRRSARDGALDLAFITDGLRAEREQGITIDVAYRYFSTPRRAFIVADAPGHEQYTRNMATGASHSDAALVLLDVRKGVLPQTRRHLYICRLLGIRRVVAAVNKLDLADWSEEAFSAVERPLSAYLASLGGVEAVVLPVSALCGENVVEPAPSMPWYHGPTLLEALESLEPPARPAGAAFRLPVQYVIRTPDFRGFAGRVLHGTVRPGDEVVALPSGHASRVRRIVSFGGDLPRATAGESVALQLADELDIGRGDMICAAEGRPAVARRFRAHLIWMAEEPLTLCRPWLLKQATRQACAEAVALHGRIRLDTLTLEPAEQLVKNDIGVVEIEVHRPLAFDPYAECRGTGSFILIDLVSNRTLAGGMILPAEERDACAAPAPAVSPGRGLTIWFTGLSGAGKTTLSRALYEKLMGAGIRAELLDGEVVRKHLSKGLGFDHRDRDENIRRIGFVAELLTRNGVTAVVSAISPYREARETVRRELGRFLEVYVNAPLETCERRDPKGLYKLARSGALPGFTAIDDPYEPPLAPDVECRTDRESAAESLEKILDAVRRYLPV